MWDMMKRFLPFVNHRGDNSDPKINLIRGVVYAIVFSLIFWGLVVTAEAVGNIRTAEPVTHDTGIALVATPVMIDPNYWKIRDVRRFKAGILDHYRFTVRHQRQMFGSTRNFGRFKTQVRSKLKTYLANHPKKRQGRTLGDWVNMLQATNNCLISMASNEVLHGTPGLCHPGNPRQLAHQRWMVGQVAICGATVFVGIRDAASRLATGVGTSACAFSFARDFLDH